MTPGKIWYNIHSTVTLQAAENWLLNHFGVGILKLENLSQPREEGHYLLHPAQGSAALGVPKTAKKKKKG